MTRGVWQALRRLVELEGGAAVAVAVEEAEAQGFPAELMAAPAAGLSKAGKPAAGSPSVVSLAQGTPREDALAAC